MTSSADDRQISPEEVKAAVAARDLPGLVGRLVRERSWGSLTMLFHYAGAEGRVQLGLPELESAARALVDALRPIQPPKNPRAALADELRAVRVAAGEALLARSSRPPLHEIERRALRLAAGLLNDAGDHQRAAVILEDLGDHGRAAEAWGAMGDLERMEAALAREEARARSHREAVDAMRQFEVLITGGERCRALAIIDHLPAGVEEAASVRQLASRVRSRLVRGNAVTLRPAGGPPVRLAGLPAVVGRDPAAELPLRDPGVSRRHAVVRAEGGDLVLTDAGSRTGVRVAGARIAASFVLRDRGELALGAGTVIGYAAEAGPRVRFTGMAGLDRQLQALVGVQPLPLDDLVPQAAGLWIEFRGGVARLGRPQEIAVKVDGQYVGGGCDLLHGDVVEIAGEPPLRIEVE